MQTTNGDVELVPKKLFKCMEIPVKNRSRKTRKPTIIGKPQLHPSSADGVNDRYSLRAERKCLRTVRKMQVIGAINGKKTGYLPQLPQTSQVKSLRWLINSPRESRLLASSKIVVKSAGNASKSRWKQRQRRHHPVPERKKGGGNAPVSVRYSCWNVRYSCWSS